MLKVEDATKTYHKDGRLIHAANGLTLEANPGDFVVIHGPSGSGKSTLLLMIGGMQPPDAGRVWFESNDIYCWSCSQRNRYRKRNVGFVFQRFFLIPYLSVFDNIRIALAIQGDHSAHVEVIGALAKQLHIEDRLQHTPLELSVGEQQRVAIARALAGGKKLILADEPTGNLDAENTEIVARCLQDTAQNGCVVMMVTHNRALLELGTHRLHLINGQIVE